MTAICAFHTRLSQRGKPEKVTLIAAMRKLLIILKPQSTEGMMVGGVMEG